MKFVRYLRALDRFGIGRLSFNLLAAAFALILLSAGYAVWESLRERRDAIESAYTDAETMAVALSEHAERTFDMAVGMLDRVEEVIRERGGPARITPTFQKDLQRELYGNEDAFQALLIARANGEIAAASFSLTELNSKAAGEEIARVFINDPNFSGPHFSGAYRSPVTNEWIIAIAKGFYQPGGKLDAIIAVTVRLGHFQAAYDRIRGTQRDATSIALYDLQANLLARVPELQGQIGTRHATSKQLLDKSLTAPRGRLQLYSPRDGNERYAVGRRIADFPMALVVSNRATDVLSGWRSRAWQQFLVLLFGGAILLGLSILLARQTLELARSQERFRLATHGAGVGIWDTNLVNGRSFLSTEAWGMLGFRADEMPQEPRRLYRELSHPDERAELEEGLDRIVNGHKGALSLEFRMRCKDGVYRWFEITGMAVGWDGETPTRIAGTTVNVDQRRLAQEAVRESASRLEVMVADRTRELEAAIRELESFSYSVSHDLRAPVRHVNAFSRLSLDALGRDDFSQARAYLERVQRSGEHMDKVIADLLSLARVGRSTPMSVPTDISALAREAVDRLREADPSRRVDIDIESNLVARGDPGLMGVVLENLLSNAWKFTRPKEGARISVGREAAGASSAFFVRDNGVGFDQSRSSRLFDPFVRLHSETEFEGTGIGLATVQRALERQGGTIWAESVVGRGTVFRFTLPALA